MWGPYYSIVLGKCLLRKAVTLGLVTELVRLLICLTGKGKIYPTYSVALVNSHIQKEGHEQVTRMRGKVPYTP